ncbi:hypothetical protein [Methylobacterium sp. A54F]
MAGAVGIPEGHGVADLAKRGSIGAAPDSSGRRAGCARAFLVRLGLTLVALAPWGASAQAPGTNEIASCSLIADPTAQRLCYETARQGRPAATFDPTAQKLRSERQPPLRRDALSRRRPREAGDRARVRPSEAAREDAGRRTDWRLQIP